MEALVESYSETCKEIQLEPNLFIIGLIQKSFEKNDKPPLNVRLSGHQTPIFNERISNQDVSCLLTTFLSKQIDITHLDLSFNVLDDGCIPYLEDFLQKNGSLRYLNLKGNGFSPEGIARLCESLMSNFFLESLVLDENDVGEVGGLRLAMVLKRNISIRHISVHNTNLSIRSVLRILDDMKSHASLLVFSLSHLSGKYYDLPDLSEFYFRLQNCMYLNSILKRLLLPYCKLRDEGVEYLVRGLSLNRHSSIEVLDLKGNEICVDGAKVLCNYIEKSKYSKIKILDLSFNRIQTVGLGFFVDAFKNNQTSLEEVNFCSNRIGDIGLYDLANVIKEAPSSFPLRKLFILKNNLFEQRAKKAFYELYEKRKDEIVFDMIPYMNLNNDEEETYFLGEDKESDQFFENVDVLSIIDEYKEELTEMIGKEKAKKK